jgi:hypothetical protein
MELVAVPYGEILIESLKEEVEMSRERKGIKRIGYTYPLKI